MVQKLVNRYQEKIDPQQANTSQPKTVMLGLKRREASAERRKGERESSDKRWHNEASLRYSPGRVRETNNSRAEFNICCTFRSKTVQCLWDIMTTSGQITRI